MISRRAVLGTFALFSLVGSMLPLASKAADNSLVGVWKLTRHVTTYTKTGESVVWKDNAFVTFTPGGHITVLIVDVASEPTKPPYVSAYSGTYTVEGNKVTHHVLLSSRGAGPNADLVRTFKIEGKVWESRTAPRVDENGRESTSVLTYERVE